MVSYERLWKTMEKKGISQYRLINHYKISAGQIGRMKRICMFPPIPWRYSAIFYSVLWRIL